jgi:hypothetical protein
MDMGNQSGAPLGENPLAYFSLAAPKSALFASTGSGHGFHLPRLKLTRHLGFSFFNQLLLKNQVAEKTPWRHLSAGVEA